jgi:hypothetical protein
MIDSTKDSVRLTIILPSTANKSSPIYHQQVKIIGLPHTTHFDAAN